MNFSMSEKLHVWRNRVDYQTTLLAMVCAVVTTLLMLGQQQTAAPIAERLAEDRLAVLQQVLPKSIYDNNPLEDSITITDDLFSDEPVPVFIARKNNQISAVVFELNVGGYGGTITLIMAMNTDAEVLGLRVLSHKETPGLADKIEIHKSDWITSFDGKSLKNTPRSAWLVKKDGGEFDQFTGATITPRAIVKVVVGGLDFYARNFYERNFYEHNNETLVNTDQEVKKDG